MFDLSTGHTATLNNLVAAKFRHCLFISPDTLIRPDVSDLARETIDKEPKLSNFAQIDDD